MEGAWAWPEAKSQGSNKAGTQRRACIPVLSSSPVHSDDPPGSQRLWKQRGRLVFYWMSDLCSCQSHCVQRRGGELYFLVSSFLDRVLMISSLAWSRSSPCLRVSLVLRRAGLSLFRQRLLASLVCLQLVDMFHENLLVFNTLPFTFRYRLWYMWQSIFLDSRYCLSSQRRILILFIQVTFLGIQALAVPFRLPMPICLPFQQAKVFFWHQAHERTVTGFQMISPSLISFWICWVGGSWHWQFCYPHWGPTPSFCHSRGHWRQASSEAWAYSGGCGYRGERKAMVMLYMKQLTQIGRLPAWAWTNQWPLKTKSFLRLVAEREIRFEERIWYTVIGFEVGGDHT